MPAKKLPESERIERLRIGATIRALRGTRSVDEIANKVNETYPISPAFLANIEAGRRGLPAEAAAPLAAALGVDLLAIIRPDYYEPDACFQGAA